eukprot:TRINITY_DN3064_c0_g2_i2.p1 TRINITY_DN3064_c0_g2~~TRINITY_DN3064_c0_g2_i2.p1  ORF type:complete len:740 (+),score=266.74 TRINITY_DN3064_c0_g2_i2:306-2222(+)
MSKKQGNNSQRKKKKLNVWRHTMDLRVLRNEKDEDNSQEEGNNNNQLPLPCDNQTEQNNNTNQEDMQFDGIKFNLEVGDGTTTLKKGKNPKKSSFSYIKSPGKSSQHIRSQSLSNPSNNSITPSERKKFLQSSMKISSKVATSAPVPIPTRENQHTLSTSSNHKQSRSYNSSTMNSKESHSTSNSEESLLSSSGSSSVPSNSSNIVSSSASILSTLFSTMLNTPDHSSSNQVNSSTTTTSGNNSKKRALRNRQKRKSEENYLSLLSVDNQNNDNESDSKFKEDLPTKLKKVNKKRRSSHEPCTESDDSGSTADNEIDTTQTKNQKNTSLSHPTDIHDTDHHSTNIPTHNNNINNNNHHHNNNTTTQLSLVLKDIEKNSSNKTTNSSEEDSDDKGGRLSARQARGLLVKTRRSSKLPNWTNTLRERDTKLIKNLSSSTPSTISSSSSVGTNFTDFRSAQSKSHTILQHHPDKSDANHTTSTDNTKDSSENSSDQLKIHIVPEPQSNIDPSENNNNNSNNNNTMMYHDEHTDQISYLTAYTNTDGESPREAVAVETLNKRVTDLENILVNFVEEFKSMKLQIRHLTERCEKSELENEILRNLILSKNNHQQPHHHHDEHDEDDELEYTNQSQTTTTSSSS